VLSMNNILTRREEDFTKSTKKNFSTLSKEVVDTAYYVHQKLGSGLLESIYQESMMIALKRKGLPFEVEKQCPVFFDGERLKTALRLDIVVDSQIVLELKSVEKIMPAHTAQILTYMRMGKYNTGFLINFGEPYFKNAIKRFVL
jgi:GxxExxY protein